MNKLRYFFIPKLRFKNLNMLKTVSILFIFLVLLSGCTSLEKEECPCTYDVNGDGIVDYEDLRCIDDHYGETGTPGWIPEDVNKDGIINVLDSTLVSNNMD